MKTIMWLMLIATLLPFLATISAKAGGTGFDNADSRAWLARQQGWRARANAAQTNTFEALPFFFAAVLFALFTEASLSYVASLMGAWIVLRLLYLGMYLTGMGALRSLVWFAGLGVNIAILLAGV